MSEDNKSAKELLADLLVAIEKNTKDDNFYPELVFDDLPDGWLRDARAAVKE